MDGLFYVWAGNTGKAIYMGVLDSDRVPDAEFTYAGLEAFMRDHGVVQDEFSE